MNTAPVSFDATYTADAMKRAAYHFRDYQFSKYGVWLIAACVINAAGLAVVMWARAPRDATFWFLVFVVVIGPVWLAYKYYLGPLLQIARYQMMFAPTGRVTVGPEAVVLPTHRGEVNFPWPLVKSVVDERELYLIVLSPLSSLFIPKGGMPEPVAQFLNAKVNAHAA